MFSEQDELLRRLADAKDGITQATFAGVGDIWQLMEAIFIQLGHEDAGDLLADAVHAGRLATQQAAEALNCGNWAGKTNGADLKPTLDRWLREGSDPKLLEIALRQDIYPLDAGLEMQEILPHLAQKWPELAIHCQKFLGQSESRPYATD